MRHILLTALLVHSGGDIFILMAHGVSGGHAVHNTGPAALQNAVKILKNIQTDNCTFWLLFPPWSPLHLSSRTFCQFLSPPVLRMLRSWFKDHCGQTSLPDWTLLWLSWSKVSSKLIVKGIIVYINEVSLWFLVSYPFDCGAILLQTFWTADGNPPLSELTQNLSLTQK